MWLWNGVGRRRIRSPYGSCCTNTFLPCLVAGPERGEIRLIQLERARWAIEAMIVPTIGTELVAQLDVWVLNHLLIERLRRTAWRRDPFSAASTCSRLRRSGGSTTASLDAILWLGYGRPIDAETRRRATTLPTVSWLDRRDDGRGNLRASPCLLPNAVSHLHNFRTTPGRQGPNGSMRDWSPVATITPEGRAIREAAARHSAGSFSRARSRLDGRAPPCPHSFLGPAVLGFRAGELRKCGAIRLFRHALPTGHRQHADTGRAERGRKRCISRRRPESSLGRGDRFMCTSITPPQLTPHRRTWVSDGIHRRVQSTWGMTTDR
jgi:hypothetical protein